MPVPSEYLAQLLPSPAPECAVDQHADSGRLCSYRRSTSTWRTGTALSAVAYSSRRNAGGKAQSPADFAPSRPCARGRAHHSSSSRTPTSAIRRTQTVLPGEASSSSPTAFSYAIANPFRTHVFSSDDDREAVRIPFPDVQFLHPSGAQVLPGPFGLPKHRGATHPV